MEKGKEQEKTEQPDITAVTSHGKALMVVFDTDTYLPPAE